ncbi:S-adenosyl-L-methionine-dependent methyltransferase, partial [Aspergillus floccosus]
METDFSDNPSLLHWENHAASWDERMGDNGNDYFSALELPVLKKLISPQSGNRALDLATGNGLVARWLAQEGALVFATDGSRAMIERARARTLTWCQQGRLSDNRVSFHVLDVTDKSSWEQFISNTCQTVDGFDIVTMNMGLMDIHDLEPLAVSIRQLLRLGGCFVATLLHPLFFTSGADRQIVVREDAVTGKRYIDQSLILRRYLKVPPARQLLFSEDLRSESPFCFHRPLHELLAPFFRVGLVV